MNLRWLWFDFVDPQLNLTREQRHSVRRLAYRFVREGRTDPNQPLLLKSRGPFRWTSVVTPLLWVIFVVIPFASTVIPSSYLWLAPTLLVYPIVCWLVVAAIGRIHWKPAVSAALRMHGFNVCIGCGYLLDCLPLTVTHCPECGTKRDNPLIE